MFFLSLIPEEFDSELVQVFNCRFVQPQRVFLLLSLIPEEFDRELVQVFNCRFVQPQRVFCCCVFCFCL